MGWALRMGSRLCHPSPQRVPTHPCRQGASQGLHLTVTCWGPDLEVEEHQEPWSVLAESTHPTRCPGGTG